MSSARRTGATQTVRAALASDLQHGAVVPPVVLSSNFTFEGLGKPRAYDYSRSGNPTRDQLGSALAGLEGAASATVTSSGMAAVTALLQLVPAGGKVVAPQDCYGGTWRLFDAWQKRGMLSVEWIDPLDRRALEVALPGASLLWLETPSNPLLRITDLPGSCALAKEAGCLVAVDNTFLSPVLQRPIEHGADFVVHSTTKYLNGHSDVVGGVVCAAEAERGDEVRWWANCLGLTGSPFDSFLCLRGLRTLHARMRVHEENARAVSDLLASHPAVRCVHDPGRPEHPGHVQALAQQSGFGGMLSFELHGGRDAVGDFVDALEHFTLAESLGGVESLCCHPATMTHAAMDAAARHRAGIGESLLRLSVGIEDARDLVADVERALDGLSVRWRESAAFESEDAPPSAHALRR